MGNFFSLHMYSRVYWYRVADKVAGERFEGRRVSCCAASDAVLYILVASGGYFISCCLSDLLPVPSS